MELDPTLSDAQSHLGIAYAAAGRLDEAIAAYKRAITLNPLDPKTHYNLGVAFSKKRQWDQVIESYRRCLDLDADDLNARYNLALIFERMKMTDEAEAQLKAGYSVAQQKRSNDFLAKFGKEMQRLGVAIPGGE